VPAVESAGVLVSDVVRKWRYFGLQVGRVCKSMCAVSLGYTGSPEQIAGRQHLSLSTAATRSPEPERANRGSE